MNTRARAHTIRVTHSHCAISARHRRVISGHRRVNGQDRDLKVEEKETKGVCACACVRLQTHTHTTHTQLHRQKHCNTPPLFELIIYHTTNAISSTSEEDCLFSVVEKASEFGGRAQMKNYRVETRSQEIESGNGFFTADSTQRK